MDTDSPMGPSAAEHGGDGDAAGLQLSPMHARMLGVLVEKALATPQNYPLSVNALTTGCNQTTNRDPLTAYGEHEIADQLDELKGRGLLRFVHPTSGRGVTKYRHVLDEHLGVDVADVALLSVLLVRGPQTVAELRARTERLYGFDSTSEIEERLRAMRATDGQQLTRRLDREPGHREPRWVQLLCPEQGEDRSDPTAATAVGAEPSPAPQPANDNDDLRSDVAALRNELQQLRREFEAFRSEFG